MINRNPNGKHGDQNGSNPNVNNNDKPSFKQLLSSLSDLFIFSILQNYTTLINLRTGKQSKLAMTILRCFHLMAYLHLQLVPAFV